MKRFKCKKITKNKIDMIIVLIMIVTLVIMHFFNQNISPKIFSIALSKLDEINTLYIKKDILPKADIDELLIVNLNSKEEIVFVDVDYNKAYDLMKKIIVKIQDNLFLLEQGKIENFKNARELKNYNNNLYLELPLGLAYDGVLFSNLGPKVPIKLSLYEHVLGTVETEVKEYGINNAILNVTLTLTLEQKLILPYQEEKVVKNYELILGSKVINGKIPSFYNGAYKNSSSIIDIDWH